MTDPDIKRIKTSELSEEEKLLALSPWEFDQSPHGWRSLKHASKDDFLRIAKLIERYTETRLADILAQDRVGIEILNFHVGQYYAAAGREYYPQAIVAFRKSYQRSGPEWWNVYVTATTAFLEADVPNLQASYDQLLASDVGGKIAPNLSIVANFLSELRNGSNDYVKAYSAPRNAF